MDKLSEYRQTVQDLLKAHAERSVSSSETIEAELVFDTERDRYQLVHVGWQNQRRIYGCTIHIDIKAGKIWLQHNATEIEIDKQLVSAGIAKEDIVLGFHPPFMRQFTEYAVGEPLPKDAIRSPSSTLNEP